MNGYKNQTGWKLSISGNTRPFLLAVIFSCLMSAVFADTGEEYDELSVNLNVKGVGSAEIPALYREGEIFLSVTDMFDFLKIKNRMSESVDSVSGFILNENSVFLIDRQHQRIVYSNQEHVIKPGDLIRLDDKLYLKGNYFGRVFGLQCNFDFRNLSVNLVTDLELPAMKEMRQEMMRTNLNKLKGEEHADTTIGQRYPFGRAGTADWSIINTHTLTGGGDLRASFGLGTYLAGGELNTAFTYYNRSSFNEQLQYYLWRHVNNERKALRQVSLGKVQPQMTSSLFAPAVGFQLTNTPTTFNRSFDSYTLNNTTYPGWIVELYVNNVLISYVKADASGFYTLQVPLVYGNSVIKLRFYGPYGEERSMEEFVHIPFNFLRPRQFEYNISGGFIEDGRHSYTQATGFGDSIIYFKVKGKANSHFSRAKFNYGINRFLTVGAGVEYLSSVESGNTMPFINASIRVMRGLLFVGEYMDKVVTKGVLTYILPNNLQIELNYSMFDRNQKAIRHTYREQRKLIVSYPFRLRKISAYTRLSADQILLPGTEYTAAEWLVSGSYKRVSANLSSYALITRESKTYVYSNMSVGFRLPGQMVIAPQFQYEFTRNKMISGRCNVEKRVNGFGMVNLFYEENFLSKLRFAGLGFRMDIDFAQAGLLAVRSNHSTTFTEHASGSFLYDHNRKHLYANNRSSMGSGGFIVAPFLDLNNNGIRETDEPAAPGLRIQSNGGRMIQNKSDTTITITDVEPYTGYLLKFLDGSFDNIGWQLKYKSMRVVAEPNHLKRIDLPITVSAEVSGVVLFRENNRERPLGKVIVVVYDQSGKESMRTLSESDGYFSMMGLQPGTYSVRVDAVQMQKLHFESLPASIPITVKPTLEGDVIDGLEIILSRGTDN